MDGCGERRTASGTPWTLDQVTIVPLMGTHLLYQVCCVLHFKPKTMIMIKNKLITHAKGISHVIDYVQCFSYRFSLKFQDRSKREK